MRSRYTAYVRRDAEYLSRSWHPSTAPESLTLDHAVWLDLEILATEAGGPDDATGTVTFVAHYQTTGGPPEALRETSRFVREQGEWLYLDGNVG